MRMPDFTSRIGIAVAWAILSRMDKYVDPSFLSNLLIPNQRVKMLRIISWA